MPAKTFDTAPIEKIIGYVFENKALLQRAFTHSSASKKGTQNYESLEFLGDSILDFIVAKKLMIENPEAHEGALTQRRAEIVSQEPLERAVEKLDIAKFLIVGKGEKIDSITRHTKVKSNLFEAIVGAIYMDCGDVEKAEDFIAFALKDSFSGNAKHRAEKDYKSELNEYATRHKLSAKYVTVEQSGSAHDPTFVIDVKIDGVACGRGVGKSKKHAEQEAAKIAMNHINAK